MFLPEPNVQIWLYPQPTDMRKSFNGLCTLVASKLKDSPTSGAMFVFINRRKTHIKILYFDGSGFCIWFKRLEQGQFNYDENTSNKQPLDWLQLKLLLEGIKVKEIRQYKRYKHPNKNSSWYNINHETNALHQ
ncbi:transposase, IS66 Orf2 like [Oleispira antarctica RB-8]|uniref:Transposase, IS66 Orf2-like n=1 Tax=Oleispira antarctica RB-8 TaxID=698738 RepID=R4YT29_OLEAN|nr:Transposase, IS66 Orf2-like [Oleispira antarctica RB-8]CCK76638.1 transposase, IS66 Orf2 like [Oleispira antarctica RB-8]CCK76680.1 transposase, IS66 Orf2 like [Oleispira antarctica RB-8]